MPPSMLDLVTYIENNAATLAVTALVTCYILLYRWQLVKAHPDEPPIVPSWIPFVGHPLQMALQGGRYLKNLGLRHHDKPIFTLPVPRSRMYIVTDPSLAAAVQRASKTMSFSPLVPDITQRVLGLDSDTVDIVRQHIDPDPGEPKGFLADMHDLVYSYLGPGEKLDGLCLDAVRELARQVEMYAGALEREKGGEEMVDLLQWIRHFVAIGTANLLYGEDNPLALHPELESAFWDFDHGLGGLLMGVFPAITARKAYRGREALVKAFEEYLSLGLHLPGDNRKGASPIVRERIAVALKHGWTLRAAARSELSFLFAGIVNTATTTFWMVLHIFANTDNLLSTIRTELTTSLTPNPQSPSSNTLSLSLQKLKTSSPTLQSLSRESLRHNSDTYTTRLVKTPTTLPSSTKPQPYQLAANSILQISGGTIHSDPRIWGPDVREFNPLRFHPSPPPSSSSSSPTTPANVHPAAFRAFGGGKTLCPGRHFASLTVQALVALLVMRFDVTGLSVDGGDDGDGDGGEGDDGKVKTDGTRAGDKVGKGEGEGSEAEGNGRERTSCNNSSGGGAGKGRKGGRILVPEKEDGVLPVHVLEPKREVRVRVRVREGRGVVIVP